MLAAEPPQNTNFAKRHSMGNRKNWKDLSAKDWDLSDREIALLHSCRSSSVWQARQRHAPNSGPAKLRRCPKKYKTTVVAAEARKEAHKARYARRVEEGTCVRCGIEPAEPPSVMCDHCRTRLSASQKAKRSARKTP